MAFYIGRVPRTAWAGLSSATQQQIVLLHHDNPPSNKVRTAEPSHHQTYKPVTHPCTKTNKRERSTQGPTHSPRMGIKPL
eukprot:12025949-Ditylum_brightwellii.AAC.1